MKLNDCVVRIAGEGGEGVISCGQILTQAIARQHYHVMSWKTFPSEIRGGLARYQFRVASKPVHSLGSAVDVLVAFNQDAMDDCCRDLSCDAKVIVYDPDTVREIGCENIPGSRYAVPLNAICKEVTGGLRAKNVVAVGLLARLFHLPLDVFRDLVRETWQRKGQEVVDMNLKALEAGYQRAEDEINPESFLEIPTPEKPARRLLTVSGNDAVAMGALVAGCRFVAGYPITPATSVFEYMCEHLPRFGGRTVQTEDEIAALASCIGASFAGEKAMTATSGPGMELMSELINLASMIETPVVIVDVQRGGPSTGLPTKTEQSDLNFAVYGVAGDSPRIVIAPSSIEDCFYQTVRAFNLAEKYQLPVILLSDASLAFRLQTIFEPDLDQIKLFNRRRPSKKTLAEGYKRYLDTKTGVSPMAVPGTPGGKYIASSLEHTESGAPDYSPEIHQAMMDKRQRKLDYVCMREAESGATRRTNAKVGIISWGSTQGAISEARQRLDDNGIPTSHLHPRVLWPLPDEQLRRFFRSVRDIIVVEENHSGQLAKIIKTRYAVEPICVTKCAGEPFTPDEIYTSVRDIATNND